MRPMEEREQVLQLYLKEHLGEEGYLYLSIIKDLYDNFIVGYQMSKLQDYGLVDRTLKAAKLSAGDIGGVILHSDQGYQYTSYPCRTRFQPDG